MRISFSSRCERHRRDVVAQRRQLALQLVLLLGVEAVELDHREHLPDLHRRAAHPSELLDELVHERRVRSFSAAAARSGVRTRFAARIPAHRTPCPVTNPPTAPSAPPGQSAASSPLGPVIVVRGHEPRLATGACGDPPHLPRWNT